MRIYFIFLCATILLPFAFRPAMADQDSLKMVLTVDEGHFTINSTVQVTASVFDKGSPADPDSVPWVYLDGDRPYNVTMTRSALGLYKGVLKLTPEALTYGTALSGYVTMGKSGENDTTYNSDYTWISLWVKGVGMVVSCELVSISDQVVKPGTEATFRAKVMQTGQLFDPDKLSFSLSYSNSTEDDIEENINGTKVSTGTYETRIIVPENDASTSYSVEARALEAYRYYTGSASIRYDPFTVVYHRLERKVMNTETLGYETRFELYVADQEGKPVKGAQFDIVYYPGGNILAKADLKTEVAKTDADGKTTVSIPVGFTDQIVLVAGKVSANGLVQDFSGSVTLFDPTGSGSFVPDEDEVPVGRSWYRLQALPSGGYSGWTYAAGEKITRKLWVFNGTEVWAKKEVYIYIVSGINREMVYHSSFQPNNVEARRMTTDKNGRINITIETEEGKTLDYKIYIVSALGSHPKPPYEGTHLSLDGLSYDSTYDHFSTVSDSDSEPLDMDVGEIRSGGETSVNIDAVDGDPIFAMLYWQVVPEEDGLEWMLWAGHITYVMRAGGEFDGAITIPSCMPGSVRYRIGADIDNPSGTRSGYSTPKGGSGSDDDGSGSHTLWIVCGACGITAIILLLVLLIVLMVLRRTPTPGGEEVERTSADGIPVEGPAADGGSPAEQGENTDRSSSPKEE